MASIWKHPKSRYWTACFTDSSGRQRKRSTKLTDRAKAIQLANKFESAYKLKLTEAQARKVISDIYEEVRGDKLIHSSAKNFLNNWLEGRKAEIVKNSYKRYENAVKKLLTYLGDRSEADIAYVTKTDLASFRDLTAKTLTVSTANTDLKILRIAFKQAVVDGLRIDNPATAVSTLEDRHDPDESERRPFTEPELKQLFAVLDEEWKGMTLGGLYTGQRLGDLAALTWRRIDLDQKLLAFKSLKTGRDMVIPLAGDLIDYLQKNHPQNCSGETPVFPKASKAKRDTEGESRKLSAQFTNYLIEAKLVKPRPKDKNSGKGHSVRRQVSELSFHSLRHTATSWLKRAGVPEAVVRDIIGHESELVSRNYTHLDDKTKRKAIAKLPKLNLT